MKFAGYFLIVADFVNWAKEQGIPVGPGRGSAAGSLVSYAMRITDIDPIPYNLLFERFLNPERVSMPDIDVDFCYERREEVARLRARASTARTSVAHIITFGTLKGKAALRDVGRVLDFSFGETDRICKLYPAAKQGTRRSAGGGARDGAQAARAARLAASARPSSSSTRSSSKASRATSPSTPPAS